MSRRITSVFAIAAIALIAHGAITEKPDGHTENRLDPAFASQRCETEATAYAIALVELQNAQANAAAAYHAWYECEYGSQKIVPDSPAPGPEFSILVQE